MMITKFHKIMSTVCIAGAFCGCADWDDHYDSLANAEGNATTLWQQLQDDPQLSDFREVLQETKVFRMHKKTPVSYADLLNSGQAFTVMAPVNGSFDKQAYLNQVQTAQGDSIVEKFFVQNHLSRSLTSALPEQKRMLLLNSKYTQIDANKVGDAAITTPNKHLKNGVLHVTNKPLTYSYNLYERLCADATLSAIGDKLRVYDEDEFMPDQSVSNGIVDGVPVYVDSVVYERNRLLERIGLIKDEDSTYYAVVPTTEGWNKAWQEAEQYFQFDSKVQKRDSLMQYWVTRALIEDAIYNKTDQKNMEDSLISVQYNRLKPEYHVFYRPFDKGGILSNATPVECSNGTLYVTEEWPYTPEQTYFKVLRTEAEQTSKILTEKDYDCRYFPRTAKGDSISEGSYLEIVPRNVNSNWEVTFRVDNNLSGEYDICAIILPKTVDGTPNPDMKPCQFWATINYADTDAKMQEHICLDETGYDLFENNPEKVDTVVLAKSFKLPACNYDQTDTKLTVTLGCYIEAADMEYYTRYMYLDCIYLRPRTSKPE